MRNGVATLRRLAFAASTAMITMLAAAPPVHAATPPVTLFNWSSVPVRGMGTVTGIVISKKPPYNAYIRTDVGGGYRYDRARDRWLPMFDGFNTQASGGNTGLESIAVDPLAPNTVYAASTAIASTFVQWGVSKYSFAGEVLVSKDAGLTWTPTGLAAQGVVMGANGAFRDRTGERLMIDPRNTGVLYFASRANGIWRKIGAAPWTQLGGGLPDPSTLTGYNAAAGADNSSIAGFTFVLADPAGGALSPAQGGLSRHLYAGAYGAGVYESKDGGSSWALIGGGAAPMRGVIAPDGTLYVGFDTASQPGGVLKYSNGSWSDVSPQPGLAVSGLAMDPTSPKVLMAASGRTIYRSTDGGVSWAAQSQNMGAPDANVPGSTVNPTAPLYYGDWSSNYIGQVAVDPANPAVAWWVNGFGVARTDNVNAAQPFYAWHMNNLEELDTQMVRVPPQPRAQGGADLIFATDDMIGFRIANRLQTPSSTFNPANVPVNPAWAWANPGWSVYPQPFPTVAGGTSLDYAAKQPNNLVFVGFHEWQFWPVYGVSKDNGRTWNAFPTMPAEMLWSQGRQVYSAAYGGQVAMSPTNPANIVWAPSRGTWPQYTKDGGKTWALAQNLDHGPMPNPFDPQNNDDVHYTSLPQSWPNTISPWLSAAILAADRADPAGQRFYYSDGFNFYVSNDGGANWHQTVKCCNLPTWNVHPTIVSHPVRAGEVWVSFARNSENATPNLLYRSTDGGNSFSPVPGVASAEYMAFGKGLSASVPAIYLFGRIGSATQDTMYVSTDDAKTWSQISDPSKQQFPGIISMDGDLRTANLVYVATQGRGVMMGKR